MPHSIGRTSLVMVAFVVAALVYFSVGAPRAFGGKKSGSGNSGNNWKDKDDDDILPENYDVKTRVPMVGDFAQIMGNTLIELHGAGLVVGLDGKGEDPPPSTYRTMVIDDMKRHGVPNPAKLLKSPNVAIVIIDAYLPPLVRKNDYFDVEVRLPPGSKVRSLNGGRLMPTFLAEDRPLPGGKLGHGWEYAIAQGPILVSAAHQNASDLAGVLRRGRIIAGAKSLKERNLDVFLRNEYRSIRMAYRIATAIGSRFYDYDEHGQQVPLAEAKTDQRIELKVPTRYRDNYPRYLDVIRRIAFRETVVARQTRVAALKWELLNPETSNQAALKLEAIGEPSIPMLKIGLRNKDPEVRFYSAQALAYLGDPAGLNVLADAVRNQFAFRVFGLAAMSVLEDPEVHVKLRELMNVDSAETRYGAFRALTTLDKNDPFAHGKKINGEFNLHVLSTDGPPMVHITNEKKAEVVLFGAEQQLRTPLAARAGTRIMVTAEVGGNTVTVSRFELRHDDKRKVVSSRLEDVIVAIAEFGATFPDVAQFLAEVDSQKNLPGRLEIDALPRAGRYYVREDSESIEKKAEKKRVGNPHTAPNLFATERQKSEKSADDSEATTTVSRKRAKHSSDAANTDPPAATSSDSTSKGSDSGNAKAAVAKSDDSLLDDADPPSQSSSQSSSRFNIFRWFNWGNSGVSGNKEP